MKVSIEVDGWTEEKFVEYVVKELANQFREKLEDKLNGAISDAAETRIRDTTLERVEARVLEVLTEGFPTFDSYGQEQGKKTVKEKVIDVLKRPDSYSREDAFQKLVKDCTSRQVEKMAAEEIASVREKFRAQVDALLQAKLAETLRSALGLE